MNRWAYAKSKEPLVLADDGQWVRYGDHVAEVERAFTAGYQSAPLVVIDTNGAEVMRQACIAAVEALHDGSAGNAERDALWTAICALREVKP